MSDTEQFLKRLNEMRSDDQRALAEARQQAEQSGKEVFDLEWLKGRCNLASGFGTMPDDEALLKKYEYKYYVQYSKIQTLAAFAALLDELEEYR